MPIARGQRNGLGSLPQAAVQVSAAGPPLAPAALVAAAAAAASAAPWASRLYEHNSCPVAMSAARLSQACGIHGKFKAAKQQPWSKTVQCKTYMVPIHIKSQPITTDAACRSRHCIFHCVFSIISFRPCSKGVDQATGDPHTLMQSQVGICLLCSSMPDLHLSRCLQRSLFTNTALK